MNLDNTNLEERITDYYTYAEIVNLLEVEGDKTIQELDKLDTSLKLSVSTLVLTISKNMPEIDKLVLANLTGVTLENSEQVYDYLSKTLNLSGHEIFKWGITMFSQVDLMGMMEDAKTRSVNE